jgi:hypothetical protein
VSARFSCAIFLLDRRPYAATTRLQMACRIRDCANGRSGVLEMSFSEPSKAKVKQGKKAAKRASKTPDLGAEISPPIVQSTFSIGDAVQHPMFGDGTIESIRDDKLTVTFNGKGTKEIREDFVSSKKK